MHHTRTVPGFAANDSGTPAVAAVAFVIVTYSAVSYVDRCIASTLSSTIPVKVLIVDNASTDGAPDHVRTRALWGGLFAGLIASRELSRGFAALRE